MAFPLDRIGASAPRPLSLMHPVGANAFAWTSCPNEFARTEACHG